MARGAKDGNAQLSICEDKKRPNLVKRAKPNILAWGGGALDGWDGHDAKDQKCWRGKWGRRWIWRNVDNNKKEEDKVIDGANESGRYEGFQILG